MGPSVSLEVGSPKPFYIEFEHNRPRRRRQEREQLMQRKSRKEIRK